MVQKRAKSACLIYLYKMSDKQYLRAFSRCWVTFWVSAAQNYREGYPRLPIDICRWVNPSSRRIRHMLA